MVDRLQLAQHTNVMCRALFAASEAIAERDDPSLLWNSAYAEYSDLAINMDDQAQDVLDYLIVEFVHELRYLGLDAKRIDPSFPLNEFNFCTIRYALENTFVHAGNQLKGGEDIEQTDEP